MAEGEIALSMAVKSFSSQQIDIAQGGLKGAKNQKGSHKMYQTDHYLQH